jgi:hypothetical protein
MLCCQVRDTLATATGWLAYHSLSSRSTTTTYRIPFVDIINTSCCFGCLNDRNGLNRDTISKALTWSVNNTRYEDVAFHAVLCGGLYDDVICFSCELYEDQA